MVDFNTKIGRIIGQRLQNEEVIWLTTVDPNHRPQPRPVWFNWDGEDVLVFSQPHTAKVRHIQNNPAVALNFNTDAEGGNVGVIIGDARFHAGEFPEARRQAYLTKYAVGIKNLGYTPEQLDADYTTIILVKPRSLRGF